MHHLLLSIAKITFARMLKLYLFLAFFGASILIYAQENEDTISIETEIEDCLNKEVSDSTCYKKLELLFSKYENSSFEKAVIVGSSAIKIAEKGNNLKELTSWYGKMSDLYMNYEVYSLALEYIRMAMKKGEKLNRNTKWWLINIGNIYYAEKIYNEALVYYYDALIEFRNSKTKDDTIGIVVSYLNIAMTYNKTNAIDSSLHYYKRSINLSDQINDYYRKANACLHLSNLFLSINNYDSVEYYLNKATEYNRLSSESDILHQIYEKKGDLLAKLGLYKKALESYDKSINTCKTFNDTRNLIKVHDKKAKVYMLLRDMDKAIKQYKLSLTYALKVNNFRRLVDINKLISEAYYYKLNIKIDSPI